MAPVIPAGFLSTENEVGSAVTASDGRENTLALEDEELPESFAYSQNAHSLTSRQEAKTGGVIGRMKKLSDRFKKLLRGKPKAVPAKAGVNVDVDIRRVGSPRSLLPDGLPDVIDIQSHTSAAQVYDSLLPSHSTDSDNHLPLTLPPPPGLAVRLSTPFHFQFGSKLSVRFEKTKRVPSFLPRPTPL
jgi:hypothetical protein